MKKKVKYRDLSNWGLATDFYHTWREIFSYVKENSDKFYIWHPYFASKLQLKITEFSKYMSPSFEPVGFISKNFDEHIRTIKFKRGKRKQKYKTKNTPVIYVRHTLKNWNRYEFSVPMISHINEVKIPQYEYGSSIDTFVNIFEELFKHINLNDKKKLFIGINRWKDRKDKWSAVSFWKAINDMFQIKFSFYYSLDEKLRDTKSNTPYDGKIFIDTKEHYVMQDKCEKWAEAKRLEELEKKRAEKTNI